MAERDSGVQWRVKYHETRDNGAPFEDFIDELPADDRVRALFAMQTLRRYGLDIIAAKDASYDKIRHVKEVRDGLWQMVVASKRRRPINILYCHGQGNLLVMLHGIEGRVTKRDLEIAESYMKVYV